MSADSPAAGQGREPRAQPVARHVAFLVGLVLLAVSVVCARELWLRNDADVDWESWIDPLVLTIGSATYQPWMLPVGILAVVLGGVLMWIGVRPRTRTHRRLASSVPLWTRPSDIARLTSAQALRVPGALSARSQVSGRTATVTVTGSGEVTALAEEVEAAVSPLLEALGLPLTLRVRIEKQGEVRG